jgi:hypothetical protein
LLPEALAFASCMFREHSFESEVMFVYFWLYGSSETMVDGAQFGRSGVRRNPRSKLGLDSGCNDNL